MKAVCGNLISKSYSEQHSGQSDRLDNTLPTLGDIGGVEDVPGHGGLHEVIVHGGDDSVADSLQSVQVSLAPEPQPPVRAAVVDPLSPAQTHWRPEIGQKPEASRSSIKIVTYRGELRSGPMISSSSQLVSSFNA